MKSLLYPLLFVCAATPCICQSSAPVTNTTVGQPATAARLPTYLVYRHFLAWVHQLDQEARASGATDRYKFAEPFSRAKLQQAQLDIVRDEARKLHAELHDKDASAKAIIKTYRESAKTAAASGASLPPVPAALRRLEREHTAILVQHYVALRSALGTDARPN